MIVIGKEEYVEVMMSAYNKLVFAQCYLHENIHRLQRLNWLNVPTVQQLVDALETVNVLVQVTLCEHELVVC